MRITYLVLPVLLVAACTADRDSSTMDATQLMAPVYAVHGNQFMTHATGGEEVPPNDSRAQGQTMFRLSGDGTTLSYRLIVANIENVTMAHIHRAPKGQNGGVVVWLYPSSPPPQLIPGRTQGVLADGEITSGNLVGSLAGADLADLVDEIRAGNAYVNVHTSQFPGGEVRGQIR